MKTESITHLAIVMLIISFLVSPIVLQPQQVQAQDSSYPETSEVFSREELTQMLAPIALYPDVLLSQILMASTYPIEIIEADRWVKRNPELTGDALNDALLEKNWDPSVNAICHFPAILALMSERIAETTNLGNAFLAQEDEVMDIVQELRARAKAKGNLASTSEQKIIVEKETIIIEPANPRVIYVPYYDPLYIYGPWWYPTYQPYYWGPPRAHFGIGISYWPAFTFGFTFGSWSYFDWPSRHIYINVHKRPRYVRHDRWRSDAGYWRHETNHRRGVAYRDIPTARKYGQYHDRTRVYRRTTRGFPDLQDSRQRDTGSTRNDRDRQARSRVESRRQVQQRTESDRQARPRVESRRQMQQRTESDRQSRPRVESRRQMQQRTESDRQARPRVESGQQVQQRTESSQQQGSRDNVFNRFEHGRMERKSSRRGQFSRQDMGKDSSSRVRTGKKR